VTQDLIFPLQSQRNTKQIYDCPGFSLLWACQGPIPLSNSQCNVISFTYKNDIIMGLV